MLATAPAAEVKKKNHAGSENIAEHCKLELLARPALLTPLTQLRTILPACAAH